MNINQEINNNEELLKKYMSNEYFQNNFKTFNLFKRICELQNQIISHHELITKLNEEYEKAQNGYSKIYLSFNEMYSRVGREIDEYKDEVDNEYDLKYSSIEYEMFKHVHIYNRILKNIGFNLKYEYNKRYVSKSKNTFEEEKKNIFDFLYNFIKY